MEEVKYMKRLLLCMVCILLISMKVGASEGGYTLWYDEEATNWETESLPLGNGQIGVTFFGGVATEHIQYNEKSLWNGGPGQWDDYQGGNRDGAYNSLLSVQEKLRNGDKTGAHQELLASCTGIKQGFGAYQNFGDLYIDFIGHSKTGVSQYKRQLNLEDALGQVTYEKSSVSYEREYFVSYPDKVFVARLSATQANKLDINVRMTSPHQGSQIVASGDEIRTTGALPSNGMEYASILKIKQDGTLTMSGSTAEIRGASEVLLFLAAGTDYVNDYPTYKGVNPLSAVENKITNAAVKDYDTLKGAHVADYQELYQRVNLNIGGELSKRNVTTDTLLTQYKSQSNRYLEELMFQYGRYLLIASSREGALPANLQGIWNNSLTPPWESDYHLNINLEMNYWPVESTNLSECAEPLIEFVKSLREPGAETARIHYGVNEGWAAHTMVNPFGFTAPGWGLGWGWSPTCNAFICQNLWEHYTFTQDQEYLEEIYPTLKGAAVFLQSILKEDSDGTLVITPSYSPEQGGISNGCTYDQQLVWDLFTNVIEASEILDIDSVLRQQLTTAKGKLSPTKIGKYGQIQEWKEDIDDPNNHHRHISHLVGLFPGKQITSDTPELMAAAKVTLNQRGDEGTGWSKANKISLWARAKDGDRALKIMRGQISNSTLKNLWDTHPPYQIDGNFGLTAGAAEMLVQSHQGYIELLPALPSLWSTGDVQGLVARGAFVLDMAWEEGKVMNLMLTSRQGKSCSIQLPVNPEPLSYEITEIGGSSMVGTVSEGRVTFPTTKGKSYKVTFIYPEISPLIPQSSYTLVSVDSEETVGENGAGVNAFDGNENTLWHTAWKEEDPAHPHEIIWDLGKSYQVDRVTYLPRQNEVLNGTIKDYELYVSEENGLWGQAVKSGTFASDQSLKSMDFTATKARYVRLVALSEVAGQPWTSVAELKVYGKDAEQEPVPSLLTQSNFSLVSVDSEETVGENGAGVNAIDGDVNTYWHTKWQGESPVHPHEIVIDLGEEYTVTQVNYMPRQHSNENGNIKGYEVYITKDLTQWGEASASGTFDSTQTEKSITINKVAGRYLKLVALSEVNDQPWTRIAELNVYGYTH